MKVSGFFYFTKPYWPIGGLGTITPFYAYLDSYHLYRIYAQSAFDEIRF